MSSRLNIPILFTLKKKKWPMFSALPIMLHGSSSVDFAAGIEGRYHTTHLEHVW